MLAVSDEKRDAWSGSVPLVADTGGRLTVLLTTPTQLLMAVESGQIFASTLLTADDESGQQQQQQQQGPAAASAGQEQPAAAAAAAEGAAGADEEHMGPAVHVLQPHATGSRFISLDF
jgi:hypothetical protein